MDPGSGSVGQLRAARADGCHIRHVPRSPVDPPGLAWKCLNAVFVDAARAAIPGYRGYDGHDVRPAALQVAGDADSCRGYEHVALAGASCRAGQLLDL